MPAADTLAVRGSCSVPWRFARQRWARIIEARSLSLRALAIFRRELGPEHYEVAISLNNLGAVAQAQGDASEAERLYRLALGTKERLLGRGHPDIAMTLNNLALLYKSQGRLDEARALYEQSLAIFEAAFAPNHPKVLTSVANYAVLLRAMGRDAEARDLELCASGRRYRASRPIFGRGAPFAP